MRGCAGCWPAAAGAHAGPAGAFILLEFVEIKPVVCVETETAAVFLEEDEEIAAYQRIVRSLAAAALDEEESRELIGKLAVDLYRSGDD